MTKFNNLYEEQVLETMLPFEDYSNSVKLDKSKKFYQYSNCNNNCLISEDSLSRTLSLMDAKDFAIITAYRGNYTKAQNIIRNRKLRTILNQHKMGVHQLVGHWQEAPSGKDYAECKPAELTDVIERSYLVIKPDDMLFTEFTTIILNLLTIDGDTQDAAIIKNNEGVYLIFNNGETQKIGSHVNLGEIGQAYSQYLNKSIPFVFSGIEIPGSNIARTMYKNNFIKF